MMQVYSSNRIRKLLKGKNPCSLQKDKKIIMD